MWTWKRSIRRWVRPGESLWGDSSRVGRLRWERASQGAIVFSRSASLDPDRYPVVSVRVSAADSDDEDVPDALHYLPLAPERDEVLGEGREAPTCA